MSGVDRYFGGRPGAAERHKARLQKKLGRFEGTLRHNEVVAERRRQYAQRGRGVGLQRVVRDSED